MTITVRELEKRIENIEFKLLHMAESNIKMSQGLEIILKQQAQFLDWIDKLKKAFTESGYQFE